MKARSARVGARRAGEGVDAAVFNTLTVGENAKLQFADGDNLPVFQAISVGGKLSYKGGKGSDLPVFNPVTIGGDLVLALGAGTNLPPSRRRRATTPARIAFPSAVR